MDAATINNIAAGVTIAVGVMLPALSIGRIGGEAAKAIGRNPEAASKIQTSMILAIAFAEATAIYVLVIAILVKFI